MPANQTPVPSRRYLTIGETADLLAVTPRCIRMWIADGSLKAQRLHGHSVRIAPRDVEALLRPIPSAATNDVA